MAASASFWLANGSREIGKPSEDRTLNFFYSGFAIITRHGFVPRPGNARFSSAHHRNSSAFGRQSPNLRGGLPALPDPDGPGCAPAMEIDLPLAGLLMANGWGQWSAFRSRGHRIYIQVQYELHTAGRAHRRLRPATLKAIHADDRDQAVVHPNPIQSVVGAPGLIAHVGGIDIRPAELEVAMVNPMGFRQLLHPGPGQHPAENGQVIAKEDFHVRIDRLGGAGVNA